MAQNTEVDARPTAPAENTSTRETAPAHRLPELERRTTCASARARGCF